MKFTVESKIVSNARLSPGEWEIFIKQQKFGWLESFRRENKLEEIRPTIFLVTVTYERGHQKKMYACCCSGELSKGGTTRLTELALLNLHVASYFISPKNRAVLKTTDCSCSFEELKKNIYLTLDTYDDGDLICFIVDFTGKCDHRISKALNLIEGKSEECRKFGL